MHPHIQSSLFKILIDLGIHPRRMARDVLDKTGGDDSLWLVMSYLFSNLELPGTKHVNDRPSAEKLWLSARRQDSDNKAIGTIHQAAPFWFMKAIRIPALSILGAPQTPTAPASEGLGVLGRSFRAPVIVLGFRKRDRAQLLG